MAYLNSHVKRKNKDIAHNDCDKATAAPFVSL